MRIMGIKAWGGSVREKLRPIYAEDPAMLIAIGQTVAQEFNTIAAANNHWR